MSEVAISFWKKETSNLMSHGKGLSKEQVEALQSLKEGDRLIMWCNVAKTEASPHYTMKVYKKEAK